jgi:hypothetical protein
MSENNGSAAVAESSVSAPEAEVKSLEIPHEITPLWEPPARDPNAPTPFDKPVEENPFSKALKSLGESQGDDSATNSNPNQSKVEPAGQDASAEAGDETAEDYFAQLAAMDPEERTNLLNFLMAKAVDSPQAPIQPTPEAVAAAEVAAQEPQKAPEPAVNPFYEPLDDEALMNADSVNKHLMGRDAALESRFRQWHEKEFIPQAGAMIESGMVGLFVIRENPELEPYLNEVTAVANKFMASNPTVGFNEVINNVSKQMLSNAKAMNAMQRLVNSGKIDARTGEPPKGVPRANLQRDPNSGRFTGKAGDKPVSPMARLMAAMAASNNQ